jgi:hypothetical protein
MFSGYASWLLPIQIAFATLLSCGAECPREGCDALGRRASMDGTGIAGVGALESDSVVNGCAECPFTGLSLEVWPTSSGVTTVNVRLTEGPPRFFVAEPPASEPVSTFGFEVGFETN